MAKPDPLLAALVAPTNDTPCKLCVELERMTPERAEAVRAAITNRLAIEKLWAALRAGGHQVPHRHLRAHREQGHS